MTTQMAVLFLALTPISAMAVSYTETFNDKQNSYGWSFGRPELFGERDEPEQGSYLYTDDLIDFSPLVNVKSSPNSPFTGNFKQKKVTRISVDLNVLASESPLIERPFALELVSDNGTPSNPNDDWAVYTLASELIPQAGSGWKTFLFDIDSQAPSLPENWGYVTYGSQSPVAPNWGKLLTNVSEIGFRVGDPSLFYFLMGWQVGIDNVSIESE